MENDSNYQISGSKSLKQKLVYDLFYPAILGSMLYDLVPIKYEITYIIRLFIVAFYLFDYCHLMIFMKEQLNSKQRNTWTYVTFDFIVSCLFIIGFKYCAEENFTEYFILPLLTIWAIALIPLCFYKYAKELDYEKVFYRYYLLCSIVLALIFTGIVLFVNNSSIYALKFGLLLYVTIIVIIYFCYVLRKHKGRNIKI
ncbi:hypothetical protein FACS189426_22200 [Bacteroidia bacterium]|nr:hypothetical protein FACS189426_22200 [Bacteroidia bacterium]